MAKEGQSDLATIVRGTAGTKGLPPVHLWDPPYCGEIDMRIASDGTWFYQKTPIGRPALVKLFASVLKREGDRYFLVTPVEKCGITVEDAPFLAIAMQVESRSPGQVLRFVTNVGDEVRCGPEHPLRFEPETGTGGLKPYLLVRRNLWAKVTRALFYDLVELGGTQRRWRAPLRHRFRAILRWRLTAWTPRWQPAHDESTDLLERARPDWR
jgi:hypothetical protein